MRRRGWSAWPRACSEKIAARMSLIVSSSASTACSTRCAASESRMSAVAPCRDIPVANSRWMTRSCRSRAIRSRSSNSARRWASLRCSASSIPMPACAAKVVTISTAGGESGKPPWCRPAVRTPRTSPAGPSGTSTAGPSAICWRAAGATRGSELKSSTASGLPLAITIPDADPSAGSTSPRASAAPSPQACSMTSRLRSGVGRARTTRSAPDISRAREVTSSSTSPGRSSDISRCVTSAVARSHCCCLRASAYSRAFSMATPAAEASAWTSASSSSSKSPPCFSVR